MLTRIVFAFALLTCFTYVKCSHHEGHHDHHHHGEGESLQSALNATEQSYQHAKEHLDHMVPLVKQQSHAQVATICKDETKKLAAELSQLSSELDSKIKTGEHEEQLKNAVQAAVTHLNEVSTKLNQLSGDDISAWNNAYFNAVSSALQETHKIVDAGSCPEIEPVLNHGLHNITSLYNEYQDKVHEVVGSHDSGSSSSSDIHHGSGVHHHHHHHHQAHAVGAGPHSSEESAESGESGHHHGHGH